MQLIFVSDLHASLRLPFAKVTPDGVSSDRLRDVMDIFAQIQQYVEFGGVAGVCIAGDLFDQEHPDAATLVETSRALRELSSKVDVYLLNGNHDALGRDGKVYSLEMYSELRVPNLMVMRRDAIAIGDEIVLHAVSWLPEERAMKAIRAQRQQRIEGRRNVLMIHQSIRNTLWDSGMKSTEGLDPEEVTEGWDLVVSGHFHRPQWFGSRGNGLYCGSPLDPRFGDEAIEKRGFWVYDSCTGTVKLHPTNYPRFKTFRIRLEAGETLDDYEFDLAAYNRIIVSGDRETLVNGRGETPLKADPDNGIRLVRIDWTPDPEKPKQRIEVNPTLSMDEMLKRYVASRADEKDRDRLYELGSKFLGDK